MTDVSAQVASWQGQSAAGLAALSMPVMPAVELLLLDGLAAHLFGPDAPVQPYTIQHGTTLVSLLLRAVNDAPGINLGTAGPDGHPVLDVARQAVVDGAHALGNRRGQGAHQLASRFLTAAVGELERHKDDPETQVRSLFHYGLLAIASGTENKANADISEGILTAYDGWASRIADDFEPPWRSRSKT